jgi:hypothetical protein
MVKQTEQEKFINVNFKRIMSSLLSRRMPQLITNFEDPYVWLFTNGYLPAPGNGDPKNKIRFDETYHRVTFNKDYLDQIFEQFPELKDRWLIDTRSLNGVSNKPKPCKMNLVSHDNSTILKAGNEKQSSTDVGHKISSYHYDNALLVVKQYDNIPAEYKQMVDLKDHPDEVNQVFFIPVNFSKLFTSKNYADVDSYIPMLYGYNCVAYYEYVKKNKIEDYKLGIAFWLEKHAIRTASYYEDEFLKMESIRPFIAFYPKRKNPISKET